MVGDVPPKEGTVEYGLTDKQERYCQLRASGYTKTEAARYAFETQYPGALGWQTEQLPKVVERIAELKIERIETYGLDHQEQVRKYHEIMNMAIAKGNLQTALKAMERLDAIGGFETKKSEVTRIIKQDPSEILKDPDGDVQGDLEKFKTILESHGKRPN